MSSASDIDTSINVEDESTKKWNHLYKLKNRILLYVAELERRYKIVPPPFLREMVGGQVEWNEVVVKHSEAVSKAANNDYTLGVFYQVVTNLSAGSRQFIGTYSGWILTRAEYDELNSVDRECMGALYGAEANALKGFVTNHWDINWDVAWKEVDWVIVADPTSLTANINAPSNIVKIGKTGDQVKQRPNCCFSFDHSNSLKIKCGNGRYAIMNTYLSVYKQIHTSIASGQELFLGYHKLIQDKLTTLARWNGETRDIESQSQDK